MRLKNKKTGEIVDVRMSYREDTAPIVVSETTCDENGQSQGWPYNSLAELNKEWEDYEEPKGYWMITSLGEVICPYDAGLAPKGSKEIGNYFETKEEAELAVEKLKALKRLKDKGFRFEGWQDLEACDEIERMITNRIIDGENIIGFRMDDYHDCYRDLNICFGGEDA